MYRYFTLLSFILCSLGIFAQKSVIHQNLYWLRYYNQLCFSNKMVWHNEFENRRFLNSNQQHHFILHSRLHYKFLPNLDAGIGLCYSRQSPQIENSSTNFVIPEIRPEQEINLMNTFSKQFSIQHRFRLDERFIHKNNGKDLIPGYDFNFRFRYRFQAVITTKNKTAKFPTNFKIANEIMLNSGKNIIYNQFDQNRISISLEKRIINSVSAELGFIHWYQQRTSGIDYFSRNILRLTILHKLSFSKNL
jgi:hypothetical protein